MWKRLAPLLAVLFATLAMVSGKPSAARAVSREEVRQAIAIFRRDPTGAQGSMARPLILEFAQDSPDVEVVIAPDLMPWLADKNLREEQGSLLVTAYCAGAIDAQLHGAKAHGSSLVTACEQVIATYYQLQRKEPSLRLPEIEKLAALQRQHKLAGFVAAADREKPAPETRRR